MKFSIVIIKYKSIYYYIGFILLIIFCWKVVPRDFQYRTFTICVFILSIIGLKIIGDKTYKLITTGEIKFEDGFVNIYDLNNQIINNIKYEDYDYILLINDSIIITESLDDYFYTLNNNITNTNLYLFNNSTNLGYS